MEDEFDDMSGPSEAEGQSVAHETPNEDPVPENKLALVQSSFFKNPPKPGDTMKIKVQDVFENEVSILCDYDEGDDTDDEEETAEEEAAEPAEESDDMGMDDSASPSEAEDAMMY